MSETCVLFCKCGADYVSDNMLSEISIKLQKFEVDIIELNDLCAISLNEKESVEKECNKYSKIIIIACYPRSVKNILLQNHLNIRVDDVLNFRKLNPDQIISTLANDIKLKKGKAGFKTFSTGLNVPAWYPVIDKSKCNLCGKCARFCLFGVYKFNGKELTVANPLFCKNNCPACGRNCPESALIFPKHSEVSVLAGEDPDNVASRKITGTLFERLKSRNIQKEDIFADGITAKAEREREEALSELKNLKLRNDR